MPIKVANIIEDGRLAGPHIRIANVAKGLEGKSIQTIVIFPEYGGGRFEELLKRFQIKMIRLPLHRLTKDPKLFIRYILSFFYELLAITFILKRGEFDLVHVSGGVWQFKGVIAGRLSGCKVVWHLNDTCMPTGLKYTFKLLSKMCVDALVVAGKRVRKYYIKSLGIINIPVYEIQAPVDSAFFNPVAERGIDMHFLKKSGLNIVSVGNINPLKGYEYFIKMAAALKDNRDLNFYIVGPELKSQRRYYRKLVNMKKDLGVENLYFYGMSDSIYNILLETDVYVCCSISEASPTSVWEAMSMAKPVLCTDVGDVALMLKDGESGFIVPCGDVDLLVERLKILVKDSEVRKQFGEKARGAVLKKLDIKNVVKLHQELYTKTIGRCVH